MAAMDCEKDDGDVSYLKQHKAPSMSTSPLNRCNSTAGYTLNKDLTEITIARGDLDCG